MPFTEAALNPAADAIAELVGAISMHTGDPGSDGVNEVTGGTYDRQVPAYEPADGGVALLSAAEEFGIPASTTVTHFGLWDGATFLGGFELDDPETFTNAGIYRLTGQPITVA